MILRNDILFLKRTCVCQIRQFAAWAAQTVESKRVPRSTTIYEGYMLVAEHLSSTVIIYGASMSNI